MTKTGFAQLHCRSHHSIMEGQGSIKHWYEIADKKGHNAIAITDSNSLAGVMDSLFAQKQFPNVKAIIGQEFTIVNSKSVMSEEEPVVFLAKNNNGLKNIFKLSERSWTKGFGVTGPRITFEYLSKNNDGIICLLGGIRGPIGTALKIGGDIADEIIDQFFYIFGKELYFEIVYGDGTDEEALLNKYLLKKSKEKGVKCVITNDAQYASKKDWVACEAKRLIYNEQAANKSRPRNNEISKNAWMKTAKKLELDREKVHKYMDRATLEKLINNTNELSELCNASIKTGKHYLPEFDIKRNPYFDKINDTSEKVFTSMCEDKFACFMEENAHLDKTVYRHRFEYELAVLIDSGISEYFLIVEDIVRWAKENDVEYGFGRGSLAGTLLGFLLGISGVDPIKYGLLFERFINPSRLDGYRIDYPESPFMVFLENDFPRIKKAISNKKFKRKVKGHEDEEKIYAEWKLMRNSQKSYAYWLRKNSYEVTPQGSWVAWFLGLEDKPKKELEYYPGGMADADLDFERDRRHLVKKYIASVYGEKRVCTVGTVNTFKIRTLLKDIQRVYDFLGFIEEGGFFDSNTLYSLIDKLTADDIDDLDEALERSEEFKEFALDFPKTLRLMKSLNGEIKSLGRHAAAVLITPSLLRKWVPVRTMPVTGQEKKLEGADGRVLVSQWDGDQCEKRGLLKLDVLGVKTLGVLRRTREMVQERSGHEIIFEKEMDLEDPKVIKAFSEGRTAGVFQASSELQSGWFKTTKITGFKDVYNANALLRPGPMDAGAHNKYKKLKSGESKSEYDHISLKPVLNETYGLIIYQEQVMRAVQVLGDFTLSEADDLRKAMKHYSRIEMNTFKDKFVNGAVGHGMKKKAAKETWEKLLAFFAYGFNKCQPGRTKIHLKDRRPLTLASLYRLFKNPRLRKNVKVLSYDYNTEGFSYHYIKSITKQKWKRKTVPITLENGLKAKSTYNHLWPVNIFEGTKLCLTKDLPQECQMWFLKDDVENFHVEKEYLNPEESGKISSQEYVYDIELEDGPHTYFSDGILTHNSHSVSYAKLGFACQWLKVYHPEEFWSATLEYAEHDIKKKENVWSLRTAAVEDGAKFSYPDINQTKPGFPINEHDKISWSLGAIKGIGERAVSEMMRVASEEYFESLADFYERVPKRVINKGIFDRLIFSGAFDRFGEPWDVAKEYYLKLRKEKTIPENLSLEPNSFHWEIAKIEALNYYHRPLNKIFGLKKRTNSLKNSLKKRNGVLVRTVFKVTRVSKIKDKNKKNMYFVDINDKAASTTMVVFSHYAKKFVSPDVGSIYMGELIVEERNGEKQLMFGDECSLKKL